MELNLLDIPFILLPLCFFLATLIRRSRTYKLNLPPSPWKLPLIGSLHLVLNKLPHHAFHLLAQRHGPIMLVQLGLVKALIVSSPEVATEILKVQDINFCSRPEFYIAKNLFYGRRNISFSPFGDYWRQIRKITILELLSPKRTRSYHPLFEDEISNMMMDIRKSSSQNKSVNLSGLLVTLTNCIIGRCVFGDKGNLVHQKRLIPAIKQIMEMSSGFSVVDLFPGIKYLDVLVGTKSRVQRLHRHADEILQGIIREHELKPTISASPTVEDVEGLLHVLLRIRRQGEIEIPLTDDNLKAIILDLFLAGTDTSSVVIAWAMSELMKNPRIMKKAQEEVRRVLKCKKEIQEVDFMNLPYMRMVIKETLRLHAPGPLLLPKMCINTCQVLGYDIQAGTRVVINAWALGRDPKHWENPEEFRPERFINNPIDFKGTNFEYLPFGAGRRMCPGVSFGNTTVEYTLAHLLLEFDWKLPNGMTPNELEMTESFGLVNARKTDLFLLATPYTPTIGND